MEKEKGVVEAVELTKVSAVAMFKASEEYNEALTLEVSKFYGEEFDLCKTQIKLRFPDLNIDDMKIDPDMAEDGVGDDDVDGSDFFGRPHG